MKPKNKTKKNKQKGGNPYQLDVEAASIFYLLYSTMMHSRTKEEIEEVNNMIFDFFKKKNDDPVITVDTKFIKI